MRSTVKDRERFETYRAGYGFPPAEERQPRIGIPLNEAQRRAAYLAEARALSRTHTAAPRDANGLNGIPKHDRRS